MLLLVFASVCFILACLVYYGLLDFVGWVFAVWFFVTVCWLLVLCLLFVWFDLVYLHLV